MSDALIGVLIGGLIASIAPIVTLVMDHSRWKREAKLEYLKSERSRLEGLFAENLKKLGEAMKKNSYPSQLLSDFFVLMPKGVADEMNNWMEESDKTELKGKHAYFSISMQMKRSLSEIDQKIRELVSQ